jgi:hypothetical protein
MLSPGLICGLSAGAFPFLKGMCRLGNRELSARQVDRHAFQSNSLRRDRDALARGTVGHRHGAQVNSFRLIRLSPHRCAVTRRRQYLSSK